MGDRPFENGIRVELGGIDRERIGRGAERGGLAAGIAHVPCLHVLQNARIYSGLAPGRQLLESALCTGFGGGRDEEFYGCVGANLGADVPAIQHSTFCRFAIRQQRRILCEPSLEIQ